MIERVSLPLSLRKDFICRTRRFFLRSIRIIFMVDVWLSPSSRSITFCIISRAFGSSARAAPGVMPATKKARDKAEDTARMLTGFFPAAAIEPPRQIALGV